jgi:hypothetical protein
MYAADLVWTEKLGSAYALELVPLAGEVEVPFSVDCGHGPVNAPFIHKTSMVSVRVPRVFSAFELDSMYLIADGVYLG